MTRLTRLCFVVAFALVALGVRADFTAIDAALSVPSQVRGTLGARELADLVEYARAGMLQHTETNAAGSEARIWTLDSMRMELQTGVGRLVTLQLLPVKNDTVVAVIETLTSQVPDSRMTIYSRNWTPMPKLWREPRPSEWGKVDTLPILLVEYTYSPDNGVLTLTNHSEEKERMLASMLFEWTPKGFKRLKK